MMTVKQAAAHATVSESIIRAWVASGGLPHYRLGKPGAWEDRHQAGRPRSVSRGAAGGEHATDPEGEEAEGGVPPSESELTDQGI